MEDIICKNCGSINDYNTALKSTQNTAYCNSCGKFIKNIPQEKTEHLTIYFGKYKGQKITDIKDRQYLEWILKESSNINEKYRTAIQKQIDNLKLSVG